MKKKFKNYVIDLTKEISESVISNLIRNLKRSNPDLIVIKSGNTTLSAALVHELESSGIKTQEVNNDWNVPSDFTLLAT